MQGTQTNDHDGPVIVALSGELDIATTALIHPGLDELLHPGRSLVLEVSGLTFIDVAGLGSLIALSNAARRRGVRLLLAGRCHLLARLLRVTRLTGRFPYAEPRTLAPRHLAAHLHLQASPAPTPAHPNHRH